MNYNVQHVDKRHAAGFHLVGPWEQTVPQGFEQLMKWVDEHAVQPLEWVAVYYGNPQETPPEKLTADTVVSVSAIFACPPTAKGRSPPRSPQVSTRLPACAYPTTISVCRGRRFLPRYSAMVKPSTRRAPVSKSILMTATATASGISICIFRFSDEKRVECPALRTNPTTPLSALPGLCIVCGYTGPMPP